MPLGEAGKRPIIEGCCYLDTDEARALLTSGADAVRRIEQDGERGFCLYAGKSEHGTSELVFTDHDDPDRFPADTDTLTTLSGSGTGYHQTFENAGDVQNSKGKDELEAAGEVRAYNQYVVVPGSIHPSGGIYHTTSTPGIETLESDDLPEELLPRSATSRSDAPGTRNAEPAELNTDVPDSLGDITADFGVENRYQVMLKSVVSETVEAIITGNLSATGFAGDRHQAEGWLAEQVGFYMDRDRAVIEQVLTKIFTENPETDAHLDNPDKSSVRKFLRNAHHREQILDYAATQNSTYDPGLGITKYMREERPEVGYPTFERVRDALADLTLAPTTEIAEHPRIDRSERQVRKALAEMQDSDTVPYTVKSVQEGRNRYYYLKHSELLIPEERRDDLGIEVDL